ncbi:collagen alpha-1(XXIII) chain-like [Lissotriton helveticus]
MSIPEEVLLRARKADPRPGERLSGARRGLWALSGCLLLLLLLLSGTALAGCLLLSARTAELQGRLSALEERGCRGSAPGQEAPAAWAGALVAGQEEALLALLQPRLDRLLQEKLGEGLAKMRTVREAPECNCPPGPPGKRGKVGRRGDPGKLTF